MEADFTLDNKNEILQSAYEKLVNYKEIMINPQGKKCFIFFSSNGLYFPNTKENFEETIIKNDKYEWSRTISTGQFKEYVGKVILVRDIFKSWYCAGINGEIHSIDKICQLLKEKTEGYDVITCGCSSGGYIAIITGIYLKAKMIFNFGGHCSLNKQFANFKVDNPEFILKKNGEGKWLDIVKYSLSDPTIPIMWFYAGRCKQDLLQIEEVMKEKKEKNNISFFAMDSDTHGFNLLSGNTEWVICKEQHVLTKISEQYKGKLINQRVFAFKTMPVKDAICVVFWDVVRCHRILKRFFSR